MREQDGEEVGRQHWSVQELPTKEDGIDGSGVEDPVFGLGWSICAEPPL